MRFFWESRSEWLSEAFITAQPELDRRLIEQMLNSYEPPSIRELEAGANLFEQGFFAQALHLILDGEVAVTVDGVEVAHLTKGALVGEMAVLRDRQRTGTVTAITQTTIASLGESKFDRDDLRALALSRGVATSDD